MILFFWEYQCFLRWSHHDITGSDLHYLPPYCSLHVAVPYLKVPNVTYLETFGRKQFYFQISCVPKVANKSAVMLLGKRISIIIYNTINYDPVINLHSFETIRNIKILEVEFSPSMSNTMKNWNLTVQWWIATYIHRKAPFKSRNLR